MKNRNYRSTSWIRILPFALFMGFIAVEGGARFLLEKNLTPINEGHLLYLYPIKAIVVGLTLTLLARHYNEIKLSDLKHWRHTLLSLSSGLIIFILWINMEGIFATQGNPNGFDPRAIEDSQLRFAMIIIRLTGAVLIVPIIEEIFWRSFLLRYIINPEFAKVAIGRFTWFSFLATIVLFGLEHHLIIAGMMAGALFNLLLYRTRSIAQCILS
ncbi:MAG: CAAX prenyl protease-related protein, partial [Deltaproteobacteria bacterium]|nr:CAAX prenyl protease-related protein [Deltaproteobacteria bacterium]